MTGSAWHPDCVVQYMILIVDDNLDDSEELRGKLKKEGYAAYCTHSAHDALQVLQSIRPALIIVDVRMWDMNGLDFVHRLRERSGLGSIPIIMYTVSTAPEHHQRAIEIGVRDYILKGSLAWQDLMQRIRAVYPPPGIGS
jgi:DNA-binding response OmpR family regulator